MIAKKILFENSVINVPREQIPKMAFNEMKFVEFCSLLIRSSFKETDNSTDILHTINDLYVCLCV